MEVQLSPQDIVVVIKLLEYEGKRPPYSRIAFELSLSPSQVYTSLQRARKARLLQGAEADERPNVSNIEEFLLHGLKYAFPPERGELTRGLPTGYAAPPLDKLIAAGDDPPPVWPYANGKVRGYAFSPLYKNAPEAALRDQNLYEMLALIDAIRDGKARERQLAKEELQQRLHTTKHARPND
jgi:DNA-binding Lrp family transcriptional regulator